MACGVDADCATSLTCLPSRRTCAAADHPELVAARAAARDAQQRLLAQSGVQPDTVAEAPAGPPQPGAVRVVRTTSDGTPIQLFAACRADERLLGGGCKLLDRKYTMVIDSYPSHHGQADTIGARWNCGPAENTVPLEAYAMCQRLPPP